jgi:Kef-type K+ transport system membrane component KefB
MGTEERHRRGGEGARPAAAPLRTRLGVALFGLVVSVALMVAVAIFGYRWQTVAVLGVLSLLAAAEVVVQARRIRRHHR